MPAKEEELIALGTPEYWNKRYAEGRKPDEEDDGQQTLDSFEWFRTFSDLRPFLTKHLPSPKSNPHILHLGCGNSTLTADLHGLEYVNQTSVDFSEEVITAMQKKYEDLAQRWQVMDVRDIQLPSGSVDVAIDKGTLDAMLHGSLWDPPDDVRENVGRYVKEVERVLKPGGIWLYITYRQPHFMKPMLVREEAWKLEVEVITGGEGMFEYFGFVMRKHEQ